MITNENIENIIAEAAQEGFDIGVADISSAILARFYEDWEVITSDSQEYFASDSMKWLAKHLSDTVFNDTDINFDDNKKSMIALIEETRRKAKRGEIEADKAISIEKDIRKILNDKFNVQDNTKDKVVVVEKKYNMVCRHGYECYLPTKEDLMEMYGLVEKDKK